MKKNIKLGILKETKTPPDKRVALPPKQGVELLKKFSNVELFIQSSDLRCYKDDEYIKAGLNVTNDINNCDILIGVKEVHIPALIPDKTYLFFSHTAKKQPYNRELLQEICNKNITLLDHEYLTDINKMRLVAFGHWAGIVGAYNGLIAFGKRYGKYNLQKAIECHDLEEMLNEVKSKVKLPPIKILITGAGRVGKGAMETLKPLNLEEVRPEDFLNKTYNEPVVCQIDADVYTKRKDGQAFEFQHFFNNPEMYESTFLPFTKASEIYIACHFWDTKSPVFITEEDYKSTDFKIKIIADISCDIKAPIASTLRASTIAEPFYGYNQQTGEEGNAFAQNNITVMAVDNLPGELPRDASVDFARGLIEKVFPSLFGNDSEGIIKRACITKNGKLTDLFLYLEDYLAGKE